MAVNGDRLATKDEAKPQEVSHTAHPKIKLSHGRFLFLSFAPFLA